MSEQLPEQRNRATIRDYLATLRRRKFVILGVIILAAAIAGGLSATQHKSYTATATLEALDPSQSAGYADLQQADVNLTTETSAQLAQIATKTPIVAAIKRRLNLPDSLDTIRSKLSLSEDQQSNYVLLTATGSTPTAAVDLANTAADEVARIANQEIRSQFAAVAAADRAKAASLLNAFAGRRYGQLSPLQQAQFQTNSNEANQLGTLAARIEAFSNVVSVAQVQSDATPPTSPSSPHPVSTALLGAVVGLILGLLLTWFLESLDRRLRRPDEAEQILGLPIVGAVPTGDLGKVPGAAAEALRLTSFRMLRTNMRFLAEKEGDPPRSILVTSALSEEGKTTVAFGLAMSAAAAGVSTLLIEADVHRPVHAKRLGVSYGPGLADYLRGGLSPSQILQSYAFADESGAKTNGSSRGKPSLTCITAGNVESFPAAELGSEKFANVIAEVSRVYELIVIDTAPLLAVPETLEMTQLVDAVVFCARLGRTTVEQGRNARESLARVPGRPVGLVITDVDPGVGGYYGYTYAYDYSATEKAGAAKPA